MEIMAARQGGSGLSIIAAEKPYGPFIICEHVRFTGDRLSAVRDTRAFPYHVIGLPLPMFSCNTERSEVLYHCAWCVRRTNVVEEAVEQRELS